MPKPPTSRAPQEVVALLYLGFPANSTLTPRPHFRPHRISRKIL